MVFNVTIKLEYKSGRYRNISWVENDPKFVTGEGEDAKRRPATLKELKIAISESLYKLLDSKGIRTFEDKSTGKSVIVCFEDVSEIEVTVEEVKGEAENEI